MGRARGRRGPDAKTCFGDNFIPVQLLSQQTFFCFSCWRESAQSHREKRTWAALGQRGHLVGTQRQKQTRASDFYFGLTFLVSGWLDSFCQDPLCFKQKYGTTVMCWWRHVPVFSSVGMSLLNHSTSSSAVLWPKMSVCDTGFKGLFIYLLGCWPLKFG